LRIAKPILLVSTPVGVAWGIVEAYRFHPWLAGLMAVLLSVITAFMWMTIRIIRREARRPSAGHMADPNSSGSTGASSKSSHS
jgi:hypothetical protein